MCSVTDRLLAGAALSLALGCGSSPTGPDASDDATPPTDAGSDDVCLTPEGVYAVCNGSNGCFPIDAQVSGSACEVCVSDVLDKPGLCFSNGSAPNLAPASDGQLYVQADPSFAAWAAYPFEVGTLFANNGGADQVRYADWKAWDGAALPLPSNCPTFANFRICGGGCAACKPNEVCSGRSPDHPWGICLEASDTNAACNNHGYDGGWIGCDAGSSCFVFASSPDGQPLADGHGLCLDTTGCQAAQSNYPGGAFCHATQ